MSEKTILEEIIDQLPNEYIFVFDTNHHLVYPHNKKKLHKACLFDVNEQGEYYDFYNDKIYEIGKNKIIIDGKEYRIYHLHDITKYKEKEDKYTKDELTELNVRKKLFILLNSYLKKAIREKHSFSLSMVDIDLFKKVNDIYGHQFGDTVLKEVANILSESIRHNMGREEDIIGRYGGEEFIFTLNNIMHEDSQKRNEEIKQKIQDNMYQIRGNTIKLTCSFGICYVPYDTIKDIDIDSNEQIRDTVDGIIKIADKQLYLSKQKGRNLVNIKNYTNNSN